MADENIKIQISADDKASGVLSNIGSKVGGLGGAIKSFGAIAAGVFTATAGTLAAFAHSSIEAFIESEKEMTIATTSLQNSIEEMNGKQLQQLNNQLHTTGSSFVALQRVMEDAGKSAVKLGFDDEEASKSFAKLFSITKDVTVSQKELKLAMDLAAFSGRSLEEATNALAMVHAGGTRVLKEFGVTLKDNATTADALAILNDKVGGSAEKMAQTMGGKLEILSISWQNLKEQVGGALAEALTPFIETLSVWAQDPKTQEKFNQIALAIGNFIKQMTPVVQQLLPYFIQLMEFAGKTITTVAGFLFKDLPDAIGTAIFAIQQIIDKLVAFITKVEEALNKLKTFITTGQYSSSGASINPFSQSFKLPGFAEGGIVPGPAGAPQLAVVHGGEEVIPLSGRRSSGGSNIVINLTGTFLSEDAAMLMADMLMNRLKLELRI